jgi:hypothetical protein
MTNCLELFEKKLGKLLNIRRRVQYEHMVDALTCNAEEGRLSLRKVSGSWQQSYDPGMSEWGNPLL